MVPMVFSSGIHTEFLFPNYVWFWHFINIENYLFISTARSSSCTEESGEVPNQVRWTWNPAFRRTMGHPQESLADPHSWGLSHSWLPLGTFGSVALRKSLRWLPNKSEERKPDTGTTEVNDFYIYFLTSNLKQTDFVDLVLLTISRAVHYYECCDCFPI